MIDLDGTQKYSPVIRVSVNCRTAQVDAYPNPVNDDKVYVSMTGASGNTEAILLTLTGQIVIRNKIYNGTNYINVSNIANGLYLLNIKNPNGIEKQIKVRIQK